MILTKKIALACVAATILYASTILAQPTSVPTGEPSGFVDGRTGALAAYRAIGSAFVIGSFGRQFSSTPTIRLTETADGQTGALEAGGYIFPGDTICLQNPRLVRMRAIGVDQNAPECEQPLSLETNNSPMADELVAFLTESDWPSRYTINRMEAQVFAAQRPSSSARQFGSRGRTGVTRGMSVGSTPRAMYLRDGALPILVTQRLSESLDKLMFLDCHGGGSFQLLQGSDTVAAHGGFEPFAVDAEAFDRVQIGAGASNSEDSFEIEWIEQDQLPLPPWTPSSAHDPAWALWLVEHPSGQYVFQAHGMLISAAGSSMFAQHALMDLSECDGEYRYIPSREVSGSS